MTVTVNSTRLAKENIPGRKEPALAVGSESEGTALDKIDGIIGAYLFFRIAMISVRLMI